MRTLDLNLLRTLVTIERVGTFSGAAEALFKTQSAITQQMQRLEEQTGCSLFTKDGRNRPLTPQGRQLANYGQRLLALNDEALRTLKHKQLGGEIRLGAPLDIADTILPPMLACIAQQAPDVRIAIRVDRSPFLMAALKSGDVDLTISTRNGTNLRGFELQTSPTIWICAAGYVYRKGSPLPLILADGRSIFRRVAIDALSKTPLTWHINYLATTLTGIKAAVRAGLGVTARTAEFLSYDMRVLGETDGLPPLRPTTYWLWTRGDTINSLTLFIYEILRTRFQHKEG
ncbi:MAG: transcriptional regulator LrhA [Candidimonas sp.]|nr:MAG: transcriptional regulator LrhA [Candidimonas sp.]